MAKSIGTRVEALSHAIGGDRDGLWIVVTHDVSEEAALADYNRRSGEELTVEEFRAKLGTGINVISVRSISRKEGEQEAAWIQPYLSP